MANTEQQSIEKAISIQGIYNKIETLFGGSSQLFCMEFPARNLNPTDFTYPTNNYNSVANKPQAVAEAEFRIADELFDISQITTGSNGEKLSSVYQTLINNYVPKLDELADFVVDRFILNEWLMEEVEGFVDRNDKNNPENKFKGSRMAFSQKIYQLYLEKKNEWNKEKEERRQAAADNKPYKDGANYTMDAYTKWLSSAGAVKEEELNSYYADAVVRGNYHEIQTILGYLNAASTAEILEKTKSNLRNSKRRSLDESMDIYPVQMHPSNWFKYLNSNLSADDLLSSKDSLDRKYENKKILLNNANEHLRTLRTLSSNPEQIKELELNVKKDEDKLNKAMLKVEEEMGKNLYETINFGFNAAAKVMDGIPALVAEYATGVAGVELVIGQIKNIIQTDDSSNTEPLISDEKIKQLVKSYADNVDVITKQIRLQDLKSQKLMLESREYTANIAIQETKVEALKKELKELLELRENIPAAEKKAKNIEKEIIEKLANKGIRKEPSVDKNKQLRAVEKVAFIINDELINGFIDDAIKNKFSNIDKDKIKLNDFDSIKNTFAEAIKNINMNITKIKKEKENFLKESNEQKKKAPLKNIREAINAINKIKSTKLDEKDFEESKIKELKEEDFDNLINSVKTDKLEKIELKINKAIENFKDASNHKDYSNTPKEKDELSPQKQFENMMNEKKGLLPQQINPNEGFTDIIIKVSKNESLSSSSTATDSSSKGRSGHWLYSHISQSNSSSFGSSLETAKSSQDSEIAMRVMKVDIDRGGWFNPTILKMSRAFYHLAQLPAGSPLTANEVKDIFTTEEKPHTEIKERLKVEVNKSADKEKQYKYVGNNDDNTKNTANTLLPTFPKSFIIAKDVVIRVKVDESSSSDSKSASKSTSSSHYAGMFSGSTSSSSSSESDDSSSYQSSEHGYTYIRIPGSQILGWFLEFIPEDQSIPYESLDDSGVSVKAIREKIKKSKLSTNRDVNTANEKEDKELKE
jgi:hypothetical protein